MKLNMPISNFRRVLPHVAFALTAFVVPGLRGQTIWTGPTTNFTQTTHNSTDKDTIVSGKVALSRGTTQWLFNTAAGESSPGSASPKDTMWAFGALSNYATLSYMTFDSLRNSDLAGVILNQPMVLHLTNENIYLSVKFTAWGQHGAGGFAYTRSTAPAAPTPTVSLTNPVAASVFSAPATLKLGATAAVTSGTVTNVAFFAGSTPLGSAQASPFNVIGSSLGTGSYSLTAVATAAGISATSAPVSISVVSPVAVSNSAPAIVGGHFSFSYTANAGLSYVVKGSPDLVNWQPIVTNVPTGSTFNFTDSSALGTLRYYEVVLQPNP
jgi:hypothetical protein